MFDQVASQVGFMNSLRTGNVVLDMAIAMSIPFVFSLLSRFYEQFRPWIIELFMGLRPRPKEFFRSIDHVKQVSAWGSEVYGKDQRNNILQKAITLYIGRMGLKYDHAQMLLTALKEKGQRDDSWNMVFGTTSEQLKCYTVTVTPPENEWVEVEQELFFRQITEDSSDSGRDGENGGNNKSDKSKRIMYQFRSVNKEGDRLIEAFVAKAFLWYQDEMSKTEDSARYMLCLVTRDPWQRSGGEEGGGDDNKRQYKRYKLSDDKDFSSLFFPGKEALLRLIEHFQEKSGKYAIPGYPHKLGLLLHGPPGTGKTSLIKALACHTKRHVVNIPLARIKTNQELMDIVFDQSFAVLGEELPMKSSFKDLIFVMEDVDAASPIVLSREKDAKTKKKVTTLQLTRQTTEEPMRSQSEEEEESAVAAGPTGPEGEGVADGGLSELAKTLAAVGMVGDTGSSEKAKFASRTDKLDLAGLLNVLDGVVDCPNRIVIMTTNHPEKLDAALIRPGRIDKKLLLDFMAFPEATQMLEHYFLGKLSPDQKESLKGMFDSPLPPKLTPAVIEQMCAEHEKIDDLIDAMAHGPI